MNDLKEYSLIPLKYKDKSKDPRSLIYLYPQTVNIVAYAKKMEKFAFYQALDAAESVANTQGFILLPYECIHWERAKKYGLERRVKIGRNSFYLMRLSELTKTEKSKLIDYVSEVKR